MKSKDIIIGDYYRLKTTPDYGWVRAIEILKPKQRGNEHPFIVVKCEHVVNKGDLFGFIRLFRLHEILG